jgi:ABC-type xylose transport system substrate-binding protein
MEAGNEYLLSRYAGERMREQVDEYYKDPKFQDDFLIEAGAFIYKSKIVENKEQNVFKDWFYQNCFYSVQDQLSLPYMLIKHNIDFKLADTNIYDCKYLK